MVKRRFQEEEHTKAKEVEQRHARLKSKIVAEVQTVWSNKGREKRREKGREGEREGGRRRERGRRRKRGRRFQEREHTKAKEVEQRHARLKS
jgi:hypothetical protein